MKARGQIKQPSMNQTEAAYAQHLKLLHLAGELQWYRFAGIKLRLGDGAYYTPDFAVLTNDGYLELHEVKGFMREAANVRIKTAAEAYPFRFKIIRRKGKNWEVQEV